MTMQRPLAQDQRPPQRDAGTQDILTAFGAQKTTSDQRRATFGFDERRAAITRLRDTLKRREADMIAAIADDFGKPEVEVILTELLPLQQEISHTLRHMRRWMRPRHVRPGLATLGTSAWIRPEPRGVCLIISPWNYPLSLSFAPLVSCLAAGNSAIIKPSEMTPASSAVIASIVAECFDPDLVTVITGGKETAETLLEQPFDHIFFTGSPQVGRIVMAAAARNLTSVTLELGGKSPAIIGPGADLKQAADWLTFGKFTNAGQTCIAPDHVFVHESVRSGLVEALRARIARAYGADGVSPDLTRIVNAGHASRLRGLLDDATAKGAKVILGGPGSGTTLPPTLIEATTPEMDIDEEEIFGPVLPILPYSDLNKVIARINARPKPLSLYIFERDRGFADQIISQTCSCSVGINLTALQFSHPRLPFGGVNTSGIGAAHGFYGFQSFSHDKAILRNRFSVLPMLFPPFNPRVKRLVGLAKRLLA